jgi:hypothetical protein
MRQQRFRPQGTRKGEKKRVRIVNRRYFNVMHGSSPSMSIKKEGFQNTGPGRLP